MDKLPFMPWYPADYKGDTSHLTDTEDLIYRRLLDELWIARGELPFDEARLARRVRSTPGKFRKVWSTIGAFFRIENGKISHKRISAEIEKSQKIVEKRSKAGTKAAQKRWGKSNENKGGAVTNALPNVCHPEPQGSGKPLNRVYHEPMREEKNSGSGAEPQPRARMSGAVLDSRPGSRRLLREPTEAETEFALFRNLICRASVISTIDARKISSVIHGFDERVFLLSKEPDLPEGLFTAVQRFAESEGYGFEVQPPARVVAIEGGKS